MRKARWIALAVLAPAAVLTGGCASTGTGAGELPLPPQRLTFDSYSFLPPAEKGWFIAERSGDNVVLAKAGTYIGQALTVQGARVALPASPATLTLVNHVRGSEAQGLLPPRFRVRSHDVAPADIDGAACVISQLEVEDREPPTTSGPIVSQLVQTVSVTCRDGKQPGSGVKLSYTQRAYPEDRDPSIRVRAEPMINSLRVSP